MLYLLLFNVTVVGSMFTNAVVINCQMTIYSACCVLEHHIQCSDFLTHLLQQLLTIVRQSKLYSDRWHTKKLCLKHWIELWIMVFWVNRAMVCQWHIPHKLRDGARGVTWMVKYLGGGVVLVAWYRWHPTTCTMKMVLRRLKNWNTISFQIGWKTTK